MKRLTSHIKVGNFSFKGLVGLEIERSWESLTDTCKITIPRKLSFEGRPIASTADPLFKKGDPVQISLGYDDDNRIEFEGYLRHMEVKTPITLHCEDKAFLLKQASKAVSFNNVSLREVLAYILPAGIDFKADSIKLGAYRKKKITAAQVLDDLKRKYKFQAFFKHGTLYVGAAYPDSIPAEQHDIKLQGHVISDRLEYRNKEQTKVRIRAISIMDDNSKEVVELGDVDGELTTLKFTNVPKEDLEKIAQNELSRKRHSGLKGSFLTFGAPFIDHGHVVNLIDNKLDRSGAYRVSKIRITFGMGGFRREIHLDRAYDTI